MMNNQYQSPRTTALGTSVDAGLRGHMNRIYSRMALGVLVSGLVAFFVGNSHELLLMLMGGPQRYIVVFAPLLIVMFGFNPARMSARAMSIAFFALAVLYGISFSAIFAVYTGESIAKVFFIATSMFAGLSIFGYTTKKNLDGLGSFAIMGMWGLLVLGLINIFVGSSLMGNVISGAGILVFAGLTAFDTQRLKEMYSPNTPSEIASRLSWMGALQLYIDFIAMFQYILHFLGDRR